MMPVAQNGPDILSRNARCPERFLRMRQMFLRKRLIIIIMQIPDGLPVLRVFPEVLRHRAHTGGNIGGMQPQMLFRHRCIVQSFRFFQCQFFHFRFSFPSEFPSIIFFL